MEIVLPLLLALNFTRDLFVASLDPLLILKLLQRDVQDTVAHPGDLRTLNFIIGGLVC